MSKTIYIGNLSREATSEGVRELFEQDGRTVESVKLATSGKNSRPRGFGFVEMANEDDATAAREALQGATLAGRELKIGEAKDKGTSSGRSAYDDDFRGGSGSGKGSKRKRGG